VDGWTFETGFIRLTLNNRPKNVKHDIKHNIAVTLADNLFTGTFSSDNNSIADHRHRTIRNS